MKKEYQIGQIYKSNEYGPWVTGELIEIKAIPSIEKPIDIAYVLKVGTGPTKNTSSTATFRSLYDVTDQEVIDYFYSLSGIDIKALKDRIDEAFKVRNAIPMPWDLEKPEPLFRKGDTVHHWKYGEGTITTINFETCFVWCKGSTKQIFMDELSFTPYNLVDGGFSQERPEPTPAEHDLIYCWNEDLKFVDIRPFHSLIILKSLKYAEGYRVYTYPKGPNVLPEAYKNWSLTNPLDGAILKRD